VTTPVESTPELLTLHAVRLKGMADDAEVAARFELDPVLAGELLLDFQAFGWITSVEFAGTAGWTLTERGRSENERQLASELAASNSNSSVRRAYMTFLSHNDRLLRACTDWQLRLTAPIRLPSTSTQTRSGTSACSLRCRALATNSVRFARSSAGDSYGSGDTTPASRLPSLESNRVSIPGSLAHEWTRATRCGWNCMRIW
jgi:hypothetical protein